jgi:hypothetical protein
MTGLHFVTDVEVLAEHVCAFVRNNRGRGTFRRIGYSTKISREVMSTACRSQLLYEYLDQFSARSNHMTVNNVIDSFRMTTQVSRQESKT